MLSNEQVQEFNTKGFLRMPGRVYDDAQVEALREGLARVMDGKAKDKPEALRNLAGGDLYSDKVVVQIVNIWEADEAYRQHIYHPQICATLAQPMGADTLRVWHDQIQYKPPEVGTTTGWHQDYPAWPILDPADLITAWVALDDATLENGCMWMVPGSHKWGINRGLHNGENFTPAYDASQVPEGAKIEAVPCEVRVGECHLHHCLTWHGSNVNKSSQPRRAIAVHYMPGWTKFNPSVLKETTGRMGRHLVDHRVRVKPGEILQGEYFPTVWRA